jgi:hypothetical protein
MSTLYPASIQIPGKLLLPALQSEMEWTYNSSQPRQGNQRVLSPGRWFTSIKSLQMSGLDDPRCRHNRESYCKITPRPCWGGVKPILYLCLFLNCTRSPSLFLVALWIGAQSLSFQPVFSNCLYNIRWGLRHCTFLLGPCRLARGGFYPCWVSSQNNFWSNKHTKHNQSTPNNT